MTQPPPTAVTEICGFVSMLKPMGPRHEVHVCKAPKDHAGAHLCRCGYEWDGSVHL